MDVVAVYSKTVILLIFNVCLSLICLLLDSLLFVPHIVYWGFCVGLCFVMHYFVSFQGL